MYGAARWIGLAALLASAGFVSAEAVAFARADVRLVAMMQSYEHEHRSCIVDRPAHGFRRAAQPSRTGDAA